MTGMLKIWITVKKTIKILALVESFILASSFISFTFFMNFQIAFLSSFFIILGSMFAYKKMVEVQIESNFPEEKRDLLDTIEDPHELYNETLIHHETDQEADFRAIVNEEKKKIKTLNLQNIKHGTRGSVSIFRLIPYLFLVLGFIALKNNDLLQIWVYLPSLLVGIVAGYLISKEVLA